MLPPSLRYDGPRSRLLVASPGGEKKRKIERKKKTAGQLGCPSRGRADVQVTRRGKEASATGRVGRGRSPPPPPDPPSEPPTDPSTHRQESKSQNIETYGNRETADSVPSLAPLLKRRESVELGGIDPATGLPVCPSSRLPARLAAGGLGRFLIC